MRNNIARTALRLLSMATLLCSPCLAQDVIKVKSLGTLRGQVTAYDNTTRILTFVTEDGRTHEIHADQLDRGSAYRMAKTKAEKTDGMGQLKVGNFARDIELYAHAVRHYGYAVEADPSLEQAVEGELTILRREAAEYCMRLAEEATRKGDEKEAEKWLTILVDKLPNEPAAARARAMLEQVYAKNHAAKDDHLEQGNEELLENQLRTGKKYYDSMLEKIRKGLVNSSKTSTAKRMYEGAWSDGQRAMREIDKAEKKLGRAEVGEVLDGYREVITEHMVDTQLHVASLYTTRSSYQQALAAVNKALSIDSGNRRALAARARIETAASTNGWWGGRGVVVRSGR